MLRWQCLVLIVFLCGEWPALQVASECATMRRAGSPRFALPQQTSSSGAFVVTVERVMASDAYQELLERAEALPSTVAEELGNRYPTESADGTCVPLALTGAAVEYYLERGKAVGALRAYPDAVTVAELRYVAKVRAEPGLEIGGTMFVNVVVVEMTLRWTERCGEACVLDIQAHREVVFGADGGLLSVAGDGDVETAQT
jgi:hypothetical protein